MPYFSARLDLNHKFVGKFCAKLAEIFLWKFNRKIAFKVFFESLLTNSALLDNIIFLLQFFIFRVGTFRAFGLATPLMLVTNVIFNNVIFCTFLRKYSQCWIWHVDFNGNFYNKYFHKNIYENCKISHECEVLGTPEHRDNLKHICASFNYNQLFIKDISQLREEKCHLSQRQ